ncbi:MAG: hypothetical protein J1F61_02150 [Clostridiales bacterium]|nr:hypothetical protein [Clostridiales bacterium]
MKTISPKTCKMVRLIYGWVFTAFTIIIGALFLWQVLDIYFGGLKAGSLKPYSYDDVVSRIKTYISIPFWIWIAAMIAGLILWEIFSVKEKLTPITDARYVLYRLSKRIPVEVDEGKKGSLNYVKDQQKKLKIFYWTLLGLAALYVIYIVIYVSIPSNFTDTKNVTHEVVTMAAYVLPVAAVVFAVGCVYVYVLGRSANKMLPHVKKLTAGIKAPQPVQPNKFTQIVTHKYFILGVRVAVACLGVAFVLLGIFYNNSINEVFEKAIRICTECIGLG